MSEELKTCPLCHGKVEMEQTSKKGYTIKCKNCLIELNSKCHHYSIDWLKNTMIERWNTRPEPRCDRCRHYNPKPHWGNDVGKCKHIAEYLLVSNETCVDSDFYCKNFEPSVKSG